MYPPPHMTWTGQVSGRDFVLARLKNCTVFIADTCGAVRADR
jgi:hypothetical protein